MPARLPRRFCCADDVGTQFAGAAVIAAHDLLPGKDGIAKQAVGGAGHWKRGLLACYPGLQKRFGISIERNLVPSDPGAWPQDEIEQSICQRRT